MSEILQIEQLVSFSFSFLIKIENLAGILKVLLISSFLQDDISVMTPPTNVDAPPARSKISITSTVAAKDPQQKLLKLQRALQAVDECKYTSIYYLY